MTFIQIMTRIYTNIELIEKLKKVMGRKKSLTNISDIQDIQTKKDIYENLLERVKGHKITMPIYDVQLGLQYVLINGERLPFYFLKLGDEIGRFDGVNFYI